MLLKNNMTSTGMSHSFNHVANYTLMKAKFRLYFGLKAAKLVSEKGHLAGINILVGWAILEGPKIVGLKLLPVS